MFNLKTGLVGRSGYANLRICSYFAFLIMKHALFLESCRQDTDSSFGSTLSNSQSPDGGSHCLHHQDQNADQGHSSYPQHLMPSPFGRPAEKLSPIAAARAHGQEPVSEFLLDMSPIGPNVPGLGQPPTQRRSTTASRPTSEYPNPWASSFPSLKSP
jgi:hypothetical protein